MATLTSHQAYHAMYNFLGELYDTMDNDTLGAILESMRIKRDTGLPVNPNLKTDWENLTKKHVSADFTSLEAWQLMEEFLRGIGQSIDSLAMDKVISYVALNENNLKVREQWEEIVVDAEEMDDDWDK